MPRVIGLYYSIYSQQWKEANNPNTDLKSDTFYSNLFRAAPVLDRHVST